MSFLHRLNSRPSSVPVRRWDHRHLLFRPRSPDEPDSADTHGALEGLKLPHRPTTRGPVPVFGIPAVYRQGHSGPPRRYPTRQSLLRYALGDLWRPLPSRREGPAIPHWPCDGFWNPTGLRPVVDAERRGREAATETPAIELHLRWREANSQLRKTLLLANLRFEGRRVLEYGMAGLALRLYGIPPGRRMPGNAAHRCLS